MSIDPDCLKQPINIDHVPVSSFRCGWAGLLQPMAGKAAGLRVLAIAGASALDAPGQDMGTK